MLGYVRGRIISKSDETCQCIVLAGEVGYEVTVTRRQRDTLPIDGEVTLWLHTHVREDALSLFGFASDAERRFFRVLLGVSGLGPKTALALLSEHGAGRLGQLILEKNFLEIAKAAGVGKKLAERVVLELAEKVAKLKIELPGGPRGKGVAQSTTRDDLFSALTNLGYPANTVRRALDSLFTDEAMNGVDFETLLKTTLKEMYRKEA